MFEFSYETRYGDYKDFYTVKPVCILDIIQDVATRHSSSCGYDMLKLYDMRLAWMLQGIKVQFVKDAKTETAITAKTAIKNMRGVTSERGTLILQNGEVCAKAVASWFLFDFEAGKPIRIPEEISASYTLHDFEDEFFSFKKFKPQECEKLRKIYVSNKEIDTNHHLNNRKSAEILMDALPFDFPIFEMNILYKKEAFLGEELFLCRNKTENGYYVHLEDENGEVRVLGEFIKKS